MTFENRKWTKRRNLKQKYFGRCVSNEVSRNWRAYSRRYFDYLIHCKRYVQFIKQKSSSCAKNVGAYLHAYSTVNCVTHYNDVIMSSMASQISLTIVYSTVYSGAYQIKHPRSAPLAFVRGIHRWPVNSPHKGPVIRKMFPFDDAIMNSYYISGFLLRDPHLTSEKLHRGNKPASCQIQ